MEIRQLITFEKIIELGSFTKAADYLGYTQSTVTSHIQELEKSLNVKLFDKVGRKNILTSSYITCKKASLYLILPKLFHINHFMI
ncbi:LysR family transcriptional regulator [Terrisporobacter hibernicus]|uniref:LysR family transcriptional regulator n=1 Tax=Terrisporobacter hibernicus TaxID=2813371 RepID=A0AAX2ZFT9_9FIRM|nr:LysR family transcriptional regulator [Terrisporobacter hibernicus]